jgi:hypothetical protein
MRLGGFILPIAPAMCAFLLVAAGAVLFLLPSDLPVWNIRTNFRNGVSINAEAIAQGSAETSGPIERYRPLVASISDPSFRDTIAKTSHFEASSSSLSKRLVFATLRAHATDDITIEIQYTAASASDCLAAYRAIADRVTQRHAILFDQNQKLLEATIDDYSERSAQLRKWEDARLQLESRLDPGEQESRSTLGLAWNQTREQLRRLDAAKALMKPTFFPPDSEVFVDGPLYTDTVRRSALAGLAVIFCACALGWGLSRQRHPER